MSRAGRCVAALLLLAAGCGPVRPPAAAPSGPSALWPAPAADPVPAPRDLVLVVPGAGGSQRDLSIAVTATEARPATAGFQVRAWLQQRDLQPSQIARQRRAVTDLMHWEVDGDGARIRLRAVVQSPEQARQPAVTERLVVEADLDPAAGPPTGITRIHSQPPWRRTDLPLPGRLAAGPATVAHEIQSGSGPVQRHERVVTAWLSREPQAVPGGPWSRSGDGRIAIGMDGTIEAVLADRPTDAGEGPHARRLLAAPVPGRFAGIALDYEGPAAVPVPVRLVVHLRSGGRWSAASVPLAAGARRVWLPASAFSDGSAVLRDLDGVGIGLTSGHGAGLVRMRIVAIEPWRAVPAAPAELTVAADPATTRVRNGVATIGPGLFGVHAVGPTPAASAAALRGLGIGSVRVIEHTGFAPLTGPPGRDGARSTVDAVGCDPADTVDCWAHGLLSFPPWGSGTTAFIARMRAFGESVGRHGPAAGVTRWEVFNEPFMWARHINLPDGRLRDPTQHGYLPMGLSAQVYIDSFRAAADGARGSGIRLGGPSSAELAADDWRHLEGFVLPIVRGAGDDLAFVAEHHYQGDPRAFAAQFAVLQAAVAPFRRTPLEVWNTECNDLEDRPGRLDTPEQVERAQVLARRRAWYHVAEIAEHVAHGFDHTRGRAIHALWQGRLDEADAAALRLLRDLRGAPIAIDAPAAVAAAGARGATTGSVVVATRAAATVRLPGLGRWAVAAEALAVPADGLIGALPLAILPTGGDPDPATGATAVVRDGEDLVLTLPAHGAVALRLADLPPAAARHETMAWAADAAGRGALWRLAPGSGLELALPALPAAGDRRLVLVAEDLDPGEAVASIGGMTVPLAAPPGGLRVVHGRLPAGTAGTIRIRTAAGSDGWRLAAIGVLVSDLR
jgi:hypothetical protein